MLQKLLLAGAFGLSAIRIVAAQDDDDTYVPPKLRVSMDDTCAAGPLLATKVECAVIGSALCENYSKDDLEGFPTTDEGDITGWISGDDIYSLGCQLIIYERVTDDPTCGRMVATLDQNTPCRKFNFPPNFGLGCCCGSASCNGIGTRDLEGYPTSSKYGFTEPEKRMESIDAPAPAPARQHARDVQARSPVPEPALAPKKRADCSFDATDDPVDVQDKPQTVSNTLSCPSNEGGNGCAIQKSYSVTTSQSNSWGASAEVGASLFEIVSVSVSFSYEYTYEESQTSEISYTVNLAPGQSGYLTFVPELECKYFCSLPFLWCLIANFHSVITHQNRCLGCI